MSFARPLSVTLCLLLLGLQTAGAIHAADIEGHLGAEHCETCDVLLTSDDGAATADDIALTFFVAVSSLVQSCDLSNPKNHVACNLIRGPPPALLS